MNEYLLVCLNELRNVIKMTYKSCDPHSLSYLLRSNMVSSEVLQSVTMHCSYQMFQHCAESLSRQLLNWHYMYAASRSQERISQPVHWLSRCSQTILILREHIYMHIEMKWSQLQTMQICTCLSQAATNTLHMKCWKWACPNFYCSLYLLAHSHTQGSLEKPQASCHTSWKKKRDLILHLCAQIHIYM